MVRKRDIRMVDAVVRRAGLSKEQRQLLHEEFRRHEALTYREIAELAAEIKREFPGKSHPGE